MKPTEPVALKPRRRRTWVKMFQPRFVPLVAAGTKRTTIRPKPERPQDWPKVGDVVDARYWLGRPYRSKQMSIMKGVITLVESVTITKDGVILGEPAPENTMQPTKVAGLSLNAMNRMAKRDGFISWFDMQTWFRTQHSLPFSGILIEWEVAS
jgi:hypothetical protein